jgi:hypothetical protein
MIVTASPALGDRRLECLVKASSIMPAAPSAKMVAAPGPKSSRLAIPQWDFRRSDSTLAHGKLAEHMGLEVTESGGSELCNRPSADAPRGFTLGPLPPE